MTLLPPSPPACPCHSFTLTPFTHPSAQALMKLCQASHGLATLAFLAVLPAFSSGTSSSNVTPRVVTCNAAEGGWTA